MDRLSFDPYRLWEGVPMVGPAALPLATEKHFSLLEDEEGCLCFVEEIQVHLLAECCLTAELT